MSKEFLTNGWFRYYCQLAPIYSFHFYGLVWVESETVLKIKYMVYFTVRNQTLETFISLHCAWWHFVPVWTVFFDRTITPSTGSCHTKLMSFHWLSVITHWKQFIDIENLLRPPPVSKVCLGKTFSSNHSIVKWVSRLKSSLLLRITL